MSFFIFRCITTEALRIVFIGLSISPLEYLHKNSLTFINTAAGIPELRRPFPLQSPHHLFITLCFSFTSSLHIPMPFFTSHFLPHFPLHIRSCSLYKLTILRRPFLPIVIQLSSTQSPPPSPSLHLFTADYICFSGHSKLVSNRLTLGCLEDRVLAGRRKGRWRRGTRNGVTRGQFATITFL